MYIGLDALPLTGARTGVGHYTLELARALALLAPGSSFVMPYPANYPPIQLGETKPLPANLKLERVPSGLLSRRWWSVGLPRYIGGSPIELFHGTNFDIPWWRPCATVLTIHDLSQFLHSETHQRRSVRRARRRLPRLARTADAIITPSESIRREVCDHFQVSPEKVFAIPEAARDSFRPTPFAETTVARRRLGVGDDFLLAVGTLEPRKNLAVLVQAFAAVAREQPDSQLQLVIAGGRGWLSGPLFAAIEHSPVRHRILLTDYLHDDDLRSLYSACRAFIYPSVYEGFGLPPLEAMACGAPVVVSRIPVLIETTGAAARNFAPENVAELTRVILELLSGASGAELRRTLSTAGQQRAAQFSWESAARATLEVYEEARKWFRAEKP
ncbi:MAG: hypothetical protein QOD33_1288 [Pyrinomonadaceae bacterium]|jgi:glycosyltransferase involved in cell wall biosynthesis|nr:hypothetical protein [Pyrinomonadaceae bacterium]